MPDEASPGLRCVTLNLWGPTEPLAARMAMVAGGLAELAPDVVALQEVQQIPGRLRNQAESLAEALGFDCVFAAATPFDGGEEGLALLSRLPVSEQAALELPHAAPGERRILLSACVRHPAGPVWVHTTHLNYRPAHGKEREDQVIAVDAEIGERKHDNDCPQILMGDFNARPESDEIRFLQGLTTLGGRRTFFQDGWSLLHPNDPGVTWASTNPGTRALRFLQLDRRIDYVFVTPMRKDGRGAIHACEIVLNRASADGVFPSDHFGLCADVQIAPGGSP